MPRRTINQRLAKELAAARANVGKYISRPGIDYSRGAYGLDAGIQEKRDFAVSWRSGVLELAAERTLTERTVRVENWGTEEVYERVYHVFSADSQDIAAVYTRGGANCLDRIIAVPPGSTAEERLRQLGWKTPK